MRRPLIFPFIGLITGIVIGNYFDIPYQLLLIGLLLTLALLFLSQRKQWRIAGFSLIFCFALISGILNIQKQQYLIPADQNILQHVDSGRVDTAISERDPDIERSDAPAQERAVLVPVGAGRELDAAQRALVGGENRILPEVVGDDTA